ncbi:hypothetical protein HDZ31DRAFT_65721 [Schizophyllum fasciatum]
MSSTPAVESPSSSPGSLVPAKRQRTESEDGKDTAAPSRSTRFWFEDGSVVLHVGPALFKVHKTMLAGKSQVFRDMFAMPQPPDQEQMDGCPIIELSGDKHVEWYTLLSALYNTLYFDQLQASQSLVHTFSRIANILRPATKYRFVALRRKCISMYATYVEAGPTLVAAPMLLPVSAAVIVLNAARDANAATLLPIAFLSVANQDGAVTDKIYDCPRLSMQDKAAALNGLYNLLREQRTHMFPFVDSYDPPRTCTRKGGCDPSARAFRWYTARPDRLHFRHPIGVGANKVLFPTAVELLCPACYNEVCTIYKTGRQKVWEKLPEIFRLAKDWEELKRDQDRDSEA